MPKAVSIVLIAPLAALLAAQQSDQESLGYIEGVVLDQASEQPILEARVTSRRADRVESFATHTDASGRFRLRELEPGDYSLAVERRGYLSYFHGRMPGVWSPAQLTLRTGVPIEDLRIEMRRPGVLTGRIVDENNEPLVDAQVKARCARPLDGGEPCDGSGSSEADDRGFFRIFKLQPGRYWVSATAPGQGYGNITYQPALDDPDGERLRMGYLTTYYPFGFDRSRAGLVDVTSGSETSGIEIRLEPVRTLSVSGRVINPYRPKGFRGGVVLRSFAGGVYLGTHNQSYEDAEGNFVFVGLPPGEYLLTTEYEDGDLRVADWRQFELTDASLHDIELRPRPGVTVSGRVVTDDPDTEISELGMYVGVDQQGVLSEVTRRSAKTGLDGRFSITGVMPGRYHISANAYNATGRSFYTEAVSLDARPLAREGLLVNGDSPVTRLEVRVAPTVSVRGVVTGSDLLPISAALVVLASPDKEGGFSDHTVALANGEGRFHIRGLVPGEAVAFAFENEPDGRKITSELLRKLKSQGRKIEFNKEGTDEIQLNVIDRPGR
jgi:hypothetical protein